MPTLEQRRRSIDKRWAVLRIVLGFAQMFGASLGVVLLFTLGVHVVSLVVVALTGLCTTISVLLFGGRKR